MVDGNRHEKYVGPATPDLEQRISRRRIEKSSYKERRSLVLALVRSRLRGPDARTGCILEALAKPACSACVPLQSLLMVSSGSFQQVADAHA